MRVKTFDIIGSDDAVLKKFCEDPYIIIHNEKIFFDAKICAFNIVLYYDVSPEPLTIRTRVALFSSSRGDIAEMNEIMSDERNILSSRYEFCGKGGGPVYFSLTYCHKVDETLVKEIELEDEYEYDEGGALF